MRELGGGNGEGSASGREVGTGAKSVGSRRRHVNATNVLCLSCAFSPSRHRQWSGRDGRYLRSRTGLRSLLPAKDEASNGRKSLRQLRKLNSGMWTSRADWHR